MALTPEQAGLCGCCQFIAVWRERHYLRKGKVIKNEEEYAYYASSLTKAQRDARELADAIRGHWDACENGSHYRRDVTLGEDASRVARRGAAQLMATLRNLVLGLFELWKQTTTSKAQYVPGWQRRMTASQALKLIKGG